MPRWKALPDELDPQVKEFASQLRRLVDRSGLSIAAVSDRTGYSKTSWERYLNGRLLAPKGAIVALAEVTGTNPVHLTTMWELAERAWSRAEMRHDMTMEAIRISQARAALGEFGGTAGPGADGSSRVKATPGADPAPDRGADRAAAGRAAERSSVIPPDGGPNGPARRGPAASATPSRPPSPSPSRSAPQGKRKVAMFAAGVVGALLVIVAAVLLTDLGGDDGPAKNVAQSPTATPSTSASKSLPAGVKCAGDDCTGQDPEAMGCGGQYATTTSSATVGTTKVEVRYSETCGAAWARISQAVAGDKVTISAGGETQNGSVKIDKDAYTPMVAAADGAEPKACATLANGTKGCTDEQ
ncbi:XRE family transcriptional regulator [Streptomyces sp. CB03238]|uniref:XRE family transcriptional regulator n=1 Tax=Streptomyces sp. CB03238 TaxID=1907777 RepID=UPI000A120A36|nr:XRE family transcriptional regulator [Streptomyces sp. CB03238]ORT59556.1 hypothetical protein BKD26_11620 [Streptomyces sp. CB03238]